MNVDISLFFIQSLVLSNPINDSSDFALHVGESKMEAIEEDEELSIPTTVTLVFTMKGEMCVCVKESV